VKSAVPSAAISLQQGGGFSVRRLSLETPANTRFAAEKQSARDQRGLGVPENVQQSRL
jgi:hypothetical protein